MYDGLKNLDVPRQSRHPTAVRVAKYAVISLLILGLLGIGTGLYTYFRVKGNIDRGKRNIAGVIPAAPKGPLNILVLGSDRRDVIEGSERKERQFQGGTGQRADTIILVHLFAGSGKAVMISIPRDLRVKIPGHGTDKINAAYPEGGPNLVIKTVSQLTGVQINHYVEINFASFRGIVDAVGGVDLYFPKPVADRRSGLNITQTGCVTLNGNQALSFVRARYIYPNADFGRIQAQQRFMRALLGKVKGLGLLLNPLKLIHLSDQVGKGLVYDKGVSIGLARSIAGKLAGFGQDNIDFRQFPGNPRYIGGVSYVVPDQTAASALFDAIRADGPLPSVGKTGQSLPDPQDVKVKVVNGSGTSGLASRERAALVAKGYRVTSIATATKVVANTIITYAPGAELKAELIAKLFPGATLRVGTSSQFSDIILTLGGSFVQPAASGSAKASSAPKSTPVVGSCPS